MTYYFALIMKIPKIACVIVNYKNFTITNECLKSLKKLKNKCYKLNTILIDNSKVNLGFAGGNNLGIKRAIRQRCDYVLLLNNDTYVTDSQMLTKMLSLDLDIVAPILITMKNIRDYGGKLDKYFARNTHLNKPCNPDYFSGACLLIKTSVFSTTGLLDDKYFLYYEDADFCLKAKKYGFKIGLCRDTTLTHRLSASTNKLGKRKLLILSNSQLRFARKNLSPFCFPFYFSYYLYLRWKSL